MNAYLLVALGSAVGGAARYGTSGLMARLLGETFPYGTFTVNLLGSALIGFLAAIALGEGKLLLSPETRQLLMPGFCGGFTTFSTFSLETLNLARDGQWNKAAVNVVVSIVVCLAGVWFGHTLGMTINER